MTNHFFGGFMDEILKLGRFQALKDIATIAKKDPGALTEVAKAATKGKGADVAKGLIYGAGGYGALTGLTYRNPKTGEREPLSGATRKALKAMLLAGLPAAAIYRLPAMSRAAGKLVAKSPH